MSDQACLTSKGEKIKNVDDDSQKKVSNDYHTELHGFNFNSSDEMQDWMAIKVEIDALSQKSKVGSELLKKDKEISDYWNKVRAQMRKTG